MSEASRRWDRVPFHAPVALDTDASTWGVGHNLSVGGIRVTADRALAVGETRMLSIHDRVLPARVVWSRTLGEGCLAGLEFVHAALGAGLVSTE
jgi:hypothetical protein